MSVANLRFKTLLQREWLQHRWGWMAVMALPLAITLLTLPFGGEVRFGPEDELNEVSGLLQLLPASKLMLGVWGVSTLVVLSLSLLAMLIQLPGLARRDAQDRSLEFWMSLPGTHSEHLGATVLAHALLVPLAALGAGLVTGLLIGLIMVVLALGPAGLAHVQWDTVVALLLPGVARLTAGLPLFVLWALPALLLMMAASAWLKRWGVPAVVLGGVLLGNLPATKEPVRAWLQAQAEGAGAAFFINSPQQWLAAGGAKLGPRQVQPGDFWAVVGQDLLAQLGNLMSLQFASGLLIAAAGFAAVVYKRKHML